MNPSKILLTTLVVLTTAAVLTVLGNYTAVSISPVLLAAVRWAGIALLIYYAIGKKSLSSPAWSSAPRSAIPSPTLPRI
jgi:proton glutamate symport protein